MFNLAFGFFASLIIVVPSVKKRLLTQSGAALAVATGALYSHLAGWQLWALLIFFFLSANLITRLRNAFAKEAIRKSKREGPRSAYQVAANSVPALMAAALYAYTKRPVYLIIACGVIAAATADTWASEIGILSKRRPVSILTGRPMEKGLSGGVSALGFLATFAASAVVSGLALLLYAPVMATVTPHWAAFGLMLALGVLGSVIDSLLGATVQAKYEAPGSPSLIEEKTSGALLRLVSGVAWIDNNMVNLLSGLLAGVSGLLLGIRL